MKVEASASRRPTLACSIDKTAGRVRQGPLVVLIVAPSSTSPATAPGTEFFANRQVVVADGWKAVSSQKVGIERVCSLLFCQASPPSKVNTVRAPTPA